jgi:hypothetical protein
MRHIRVLVCEVDDQTPDTMRELAAFDLPPADVAALQPETALDALEQTTQEVGNAVLRRVVQAQWAAIDTQLAAQYRQRFPPHALTADGHAPVTVASRFGRLELPRQVFAHTDPTVQPTHVLPSNPLLPPHHGLIITRGLQEWACLLPQDLPFAPAARLLGWQTHEAEVLSDTTVRMLVRRHGQVIRHAEATEVAALLERDDLALLTPQVVPTTQPRRRAGWPADLSAAVDAALVAGERRTPHGVTWADWERVLQARRQEATCPLEDLRTLGPQLGADEVLLTADEVLTRTPEKRHFWELRTARLVTPAGTRYLSGTGAAFLHLLLVVALVSAGRTRTLLLVADGARWIRDWFAAVQAVLPRSQLVLDWHHLRQKCRDFASMVCRGREAKAALLKEVYQHLWQGESAAAVAVLEAYRPQAKAGAWLETWISHLQARMPYMPNYRQRRREQHYIGSGQVEKANDLLVAQRQKGRGMHWSLETSDALTALRTLMLNGGWDRYWQHREVLPFVAS